MSTILISICTELKTSMRELLKTQVYYLCHTLGHPNDEMVQLIRAALKHLPPEERAIITMFYYEEMSLKEIAFVTGSIPTTIASKLSRTRKKLCRIIKMLQS